jgi:hypothetical protein
MEQREDAKTAHRWPAEQTDQDTSWLMARQAAMERELEQLKMPADAWQEIIIRPVRPRDLDDPAETCLSVPWARRRPLKSRITQLHLSRDRWRRNIDTYRAFWAAAIARLCVDALKTKSPHQRLMLGALLERCEQFRRNPESSTEAFHRAAHVRPSKDRLRREREKLYEEIRAVAQRLRLTRGLYSVAAAIYRNATIQAKAMNVNPGGKPYSISAIVGIIRSPK